MGADHLTRFARVDFHSDERVFGIKDEDRFWIGTAFSLNPRRRLLYNVFNIQRHLTSRRTLRVFRDQAMLSGAKRQSQREPLRPWSFGLQISD